MFSNQSKQYIEKSQKLNLSQESYWRLLLHMPSDTSEIDDTSFFISKNGKHNAKDELEATIEALLNETSFDDTSYACRFPARKEWLRQVLDIKEFPQVNCKEYNDLIGRLKPQSVTLVFSSAHINSPASMFGHTFLRINSSYNSKLLAYAVNYAAQADQSTENGILFAIKGLFGGYVGKYSLLPYYDKLKTYTDTEQRDIWEYDLNLTKEETMQMVRHIWELNDIYSDYYFFDENCSYNILWLLEIARDGVKLRDDFFYYVNPPETIFSIKDDNLIQQINYRPSKRSILLEYENILDKHEEEIVKELALGKLEAKKFVEEIDTLDDRRKKMVLEAALELSEYYYIERDVTNDEYLKIFHNLSAYRATMGSGEKIEIKRPSSPDNGHETAMFTLQSEYKNDDISYLFGIRGSYHDITNSDIGFLKGTQIEFFKALFKYDDELSIEEFKLLNISSYASSSAFFKPFSWNANFAWDRNFLDEDLHFSASIGAGQTWDNVFGYHYMMLEPIFYATEDPTFGLGATFGAVIYEGEKFKSNIELKERVFDDKETQFIGNFTQSWDVQRNVSLQLQYSYLQRDIKDSSALKLAINYFF